MFNGKQVSVVLATYREKNSISRSIEEFFQTGLVDEVIVVNNNAESGTDEEVKKTKARIVHESEQGYGYAFRRGITEAVGDYVILCEPDGTFCGKDLVRFLAYVSDFDVVLGSRTNRSTLEKGTDMGALRRFGNVVYAKIIEILFGAKTITDIGCTYKLFTKDALSKIGPEFKTNNPLFATELILLLVSHKISFVEIPVSFRRRIGHSTIISHWYKWIIWGTRVFAYIWFFWIGWNFKKFKKLL
ncbi:MAG: hypothetical protein A3I89_01920 [Candidatus Harrisonbacteria bacterium RIFCSPLOWO2_02_FULL_41_11]|uniref:Glycosyltransferase 2-like domain-containing protein n=1 Tax=Candidatus Harrisonbacteria bacterium RIFCSPHIGHO2_02_FULL_42_16 TaxID=1798404 RepID=A0A1G1ZFQ4_9BACT|nr:MAG: hypothetical protein A3B92_01890 [Candidatus Harrisonbacteria bacterium RIFCSPHIGHO2_02_FULL_42_16]OGY65620.1 MAG: hypothetical protein A3I89_01920 [Candidatus Harrisonbacteria bacterium RIFCSPLOWO2_02_FULL_41_11]